MSSAVADVRTSSGKSWYLIITTFVLAIDQFSKYWVARLLRDGSEIDVIEGFLKISYTENKGIAFGMLSNGDMRWLLIAVSIAAIAVVSYYMMRTPASNILLLWSLALLEAGICGNLIDRIRLGRVVDFILVYYKTFQWPVFNVADTAITIGAALMAIDLFISPQSDKTTAAERRESPLLEKEQSVEE